MARTPAVLPGAGREEESSSSSSEEEEVEEVDAPAEGAAAPAERAAAEQPAPSLKAIQHNLNAIQAAIVGLTSAVAAATAMGQAVVKAVSPTPAGASPPGPFLRSPLSSGINNVIDLNSKEGRKHYEQATKSLFPSIKVRCGA
jgi:hypothetical protein